MAYSVSTEDDDGPKKNESIVDKAKRCWKLVQEAESNQRTRERDAIAFQIPENQWTERAKEQRKGRPMLSVSLLKQPMQLIQNQAAQAQLGVDIHPVNEGATDELAEIKQGIYRRIERDSNAAQARLWALDRAKQCGRGWYRVNTQWDEDGDDPWDQEIVIERILHQDSVYMDPSSVQPDFSDAEWAFVASWMPLDKFRREYPHAKVSDVSDSAFRDMVERDPEWVRVHNGKQAILVVEYFYKKHDYGVVEGEEIERQDGTKSKRTRKRDKVSVKWCKLAGCEDEPLEETDWPGRYIPLIPVIGVELQPIDGERRWEGMVQPAMDAQRIYNHAISSVVEDVARLSKAPYVGAHGQFEGFAQDWVDANVTNIPYLEYNAKVDGLPNPLPPPSPMQIDGAKMQLSMQLAEMGKNLIQSATAIYDPSLGIGQRNESGRKVLALQQQADVGTSNYTQNLANISMRYEAMVVLDLMPHIYDRPGRITRVLGKEDDTKTVILGQPFVVDPATGQPQPAPVNPQTQQPIDPNAKMFDISRGKYSLSTTIGKSQQTRLQEGAEEMGKILEAAPQLMIPLGATYFRFRDFPGAPEIADILKKMRDMQFPDLGDDKEALSPQELQSQLAAAQQQMQQMQQQMQQMQMALETDKAKQEATILKAQMDNAAKVQVSQSEQQTKLLIAQITAESKAQMEAMAERIEKQLLALKDMGETRGRHEDHAHERGMQVEEHRHERALQREKSAFDVAKTGLQQMQASDDKRQDREHDASMKAADQGVRMDVIVPEGE